MGAGVCVLLSCLDCARSGRAVTRRLPRLEGCTDITRTGAVPGSTAVCWQVFLSLLSAALCSTRLCLLLSLSVSACLDTIVCCCLSTSASLLTVTYCSACCVAVCAGSCVAVCAAVTDDAGSCVAVYAAVTDGAGSRGLLLKQCSRSSRYKTHCCTMCSTQQQPSCLWFTTAAVTQLSITQLSLTWLDRTVGMGNSGGHQQAREAQRVHDDGQEGKSDAGSATTVHVLRKRSRPKDSRSSGNLLAPRATTAHPLLCSFLTSNRIWHDSGHNGVNCCLYLLVALLYRC